MSQPDLRVANKTDQERQQTAHEIAEITLGGFFDTLRSIWRLLRWMKGARRSGGILIKVYEGDVKSVKLELDMGKKEFENFCVDEL